MRKGADVVGVPGPGQRPREVTWAFLALAVAALASLVGSLSLFGLTSWLRVQLAKTYATGHKGKTISAHDLMTEVHNAKVGGVQQAVLGIAALSFVAYGVYRGRSWSRWGTVGVWGLGSFSGMIFGVFSLAAVVARAPIAYKGAAFVAALGALAAVVCTNLRASTTYFALSKPVRGPGAASGAPARGGLFGGLLGGPRAPATRGGSAAAPKAGSSSAATATAGSSASSATATSSAAPGNERADRSRSKQRADTAAVAKGAELARTRAKASSKSRRRADA